MKLMEKHIDIIMSDGKPRSISQILDLLFENRKRNSNHIPTRQELSKFLNKNYSKEMRLEKHPLSLSITDCKKYPTAYYRKVIE